MFNVGSVGGYLKLDISGWTRSISTAQFSLRSLAMTMTKTGAMMLGSIVLLEREFGKFDKAIRHATSVTETTTKEFEQMSDMALDASVRWNKAATDTAQAFYYLGSAGLTVTEQLQAFNDTIMLSRAMGSSLAMTVEGMVDIVRAFGLEFSDAADIADQLTKTVISANLHFQDLDQALAYASSTARLTNNTLAETAAMIGIMANAGIKGSMAGTVLRRAMTNLMSPTGEMAGLVYELGLHIYDATGQMKPFIDIIGEISDKLAGTSEEYRNMVFEVLFGRRAIAGQITLFNYGSVALRRYANEIKNAGGTTERVAKKQMKALTEILGQMFREAQRAAIGLGKLLAPALEKVANQIRYDMKAFEEYIQANKDAVLNAMKWITVLGVTFVIGAPLLLLITNLTNQFILLAAAIGKSALALATNPFAVLVLGLYTLRATLTTDFWKEAWENQILPFLKNMGKGFADTITQILWEFSLIPRGIKEFFREADNLMGTFGARMVLFVEGLLEAVTSGGLKTTKIQEFIRQIGKDIKYILFEPVSVMDMFGFKSREEMNASYKKFADDLGIVAGQMATSAGDAFLTGWEVIKSGAVDIKDAVADQFKDDVEMLETYLTAFIDKIKEKSPMLRVAIEELMKAFDVLADIKKIFMKKEPVLIGLQLPKYKVPEWYREHIIALREMVKQEMIELNKSIKQKSYWAEQWEFGVVETIKNLKSWSTAFTEVNSNMRSEWANTIEDLITKGGNLVDFMENMFLGILHAFNRLAAEVLASDLWYALFGQGRPLEPGTMTLLFQKRVMGELDIRPELEAMRIRNREMMMPPWQGYTPQLGQFPQKAVPVYIDITNKGTPVDFRVTDYQVTAKRVVISAVMEELNTNPSFKRAVRG